MNVFVVFLFIACVGVTLFGAAVMITHIVNVLRLTGYLDLTFGISVVGIYFILVWIPLWLTQYVKSQK